MLNAQKDWFVKSQAWFRWDRILQRMGGDYKSCLALSIQPLNDFDNEWETMKEIRIREHVTVEDSRNFTHHYPEGVGNYLSQNVGQRIADIILNEDFMSSVNWGAFHNLNKAWVTGGGIPFIVTAREPFKYPELIEVWENHLLGKNENGIRARHMQSLVSNMCLLNPTVDKITAIGNNNGLPAGDYYTYSFGCLGIQFGLKDGDISSTAFGDVFLNTRKVRSPMVIIGKDKFVIYTAKMASGKLTEVELFKI